MQQLGNGRQLAAILAALIIATGCAGPAPSRPGGPSAPTATASAEPQPTPTAAPLAWTPLQTGGLTKVATLEPTKGGPDGVAPDTAFTLTSLDGRAPADLAKALVAVPAIAFTVASAAGPTAVLKPAKPLTAGVAYRIALRRADGTTEAAWAATAVGPLSVTGSVPGSNSRDVPTDAGIEFKLSQTGVTPADIAKHLTVSPPTAGTFKISGRLVAYVPAKPLAAKTLYTVTLSAGLTAGVAEPLAEAFQLRFETAGDTVPAAWVRFAHPLTDATPRERAGLAVWFDSEPTDDTQPSRDVPVTVHRIATLGDAQRAYRAIAAFPDWTMTSAAKAVATDGLARVVAATLHIASSERGANYIQLPTALDAGWYVVTATYQGIPRQTLLQITDTATFALVSGNRTVVWVNSLATGLAAEGATATLDGTPLGTVNADGLLVAPTPADLGLGDGPAPLLTVRHGGRASFRAVDVHAYCGGCASIDGAAGPARTADDYWSMLQLDRNQYRATDTVAAYGVARERATDDAPASVRLAVWLDEGGGSPLPVATASASPDARGMFSAKIPIADLPQGAYRVRLTIGSVELGDTWFVVAPYIKPAWRMSVSLGRHALIDGQSVPTTAGATFFEGTPVAGASLAFTAEGTEDSVSVTAATGGDGTATADVPVRLSPDADQMASVQVWVRPELPEEANLEQSATLYVFRASALVSVDAALAAKKLKVSGSVNSVVFSRYETAEGIADPAGVDPKGAGRANAAVTVTVTEATPYRVKTGSEYSFITKRVEPIYETRTKKVVVATRTLHADAAGAFRLTLDVDGGNSSYEVLASYRDEAGRNASQTAWAATSAPSEDEWWPHLRAAGLPAHADGYAVGDPVSIAFKGGLTGSAVARYLFLEHQNGLRTAVVRDTATYTTVFGAADVPAVQFSGIRFNGVGYEVSIASFTASLRPAERTLDVTLTADKPRYEPGDTATITVTTRDATGKPVAASLFVRAIDEKLYALGIAADPEPFRELYRALDTGVLGWAWSHQAPSEDLGGWGDASGGGDSGVRSDFRDFLYQGAVTTDADGRATVQIPLSDDLTSWHVSAVGVDAALDAGVGTAMVAVGLPFFVDALLPAELLAADKPVLRVRAFGTGLTAGDAVTFTVGSDTLGMPPVTVNGTAFNAVEVPLPALALGTQRLQIAATHGTGSGAGKLSDAMVRTVSVVDHRSPQLRTTWVRLDAPLTLAAGTGSTRLVLADAGRGRVIPLLQALVAEGTTRADTALAAELAKRVLAGQFGLDPGIPAVDGALTAFARDDGLSIVPWGSTDLDATVLAALAGEPSLTPTKLLAGLRGFAWGSGPRVDRLEALAGLTALGEPVLDELHAAAAQTDLTLTEQVFLAVGALFAGDETLAGTLEQQLLAAHGERSGALVRLNAGGDEADIAATAWLAIVAASLGDPVAADMDAWLALNPAGTTDATAQRAIAARGWAMRVAGAPAKVTLSLGGASQEVSIEAGQPAAYTLTPAQAAGAVVTPVSGTVLVIQTWEAPLDPASLTAPSGVSISRTVTPSGTIGATDTVTVTYLVDLGARTPGAIWRLVDLVPSGLAPLANPGWAPTEEGTWPGETPVGVVGQRVEFSVGLDAKRTQFSLRYTARVVAPGTYVWEPAALQLVGNPAMGVVVPASVVRIAGATP